MGGGCQDGLWVFFQLRESAIREEAPNLQGSCLALGFPSAQNDWALNFAQVPVLGNQLSYTSDSRKLEMMRQLNIGERS